jgi:hypothetical protein
MTTEDVIAFEADGHEAGGPLDWTVMACGISREI